jgi:hypothetical protein
MIGRALRATYVFAILAIMTAWVWLAYSAISWAVFG